MHHILITGAKGQVGSALAGVTWPEYCRIAAYDRQALDITNREAVVRAVGRMRPSLIINTAAYTTVDLAEDEPDKAYAVNDLAVGYLAEAAAEAGSPLIHFSTDYVFNGETDADYMEEASTQPLGEYGKSKLAGEQRLQSMWPSHIIIRASGVFDATGKNFVRTIFNTGRTRGELTVVNDQTVGPTWAVDIAKAVVSVAAGVLTGALEPPWGIYHYCSKPTLTWFDFAHEIFDVAAELGFERPAINPIAGADYPAKARRPKNPALNCQKFERTFGLAMPGRSHALRTVLKEIGD